MCSGECYLVASGLARVIYDSDITYTSYDSIGYTTLPGYMGWRVAVPAYYRMGSLSAVGSGRESAPVVQSRNSVTRIRTPFKVLKPTCKYLISEFVEI